MDFTFLKYFEVLPENVAHERRRPGQEVLLAHGAHVAASHAKLADEDALQRELFDGPGQPATHLRFRPQPRIWTPSQKK